MTIMMRENIILKKKKYKNQTFSYENSVSNSTLSKLHNMYKQMIFIE